MDLRTAAKATFSWLFKTEVPEDVELCLKLTKQCVEQAVMMTSSHTSSPKFNRGQCKYLADKLEMVVMKAHSFFNAQIRVWYSNYASTHDKAQCLENFKLLFALGKEVESFIQSCCKDEWIQSAIMLTYASERVSTIGFNLEFYTIVFSKRKTVRAPPSVTIAEVSSVRQAEAEIVKEKANIDKQRLCEDLSALLESSILSSTECQLATVLLGSLKGARLHPDSNLPESSQSISHLDIIGRSVTQKERLGKGSYGTVHKATWLGAEVAKKSFYGPGNPDFVQEVSILEGLYHPNIVSLFWHMVDEQKCHIIMELMDSDLTTILEERLQACGSHKPPFSISEAFDIMLQVAEGVLFLHDKKIVHRDLKSNNILVKIVKVREMNVTYMEVKVADFGLSRTKERSMTYSYQTPNMGTTRWMAPELMNTQNERVGESEVGLKYPFKSDVYSFGMVCYEILTGCIPFSTLSPKEVRKEVLGGGRPQLPDQCPIKLRTLIKECWNSNPSERPHFSEICKELRQMKCSHFMTSAWARVPRCFSFDEIKSMTYNFDEVGKRDSWHFPRPVLFQADFYKGVMLDTGEVVTVERPRCEDNFNHQMKVVPGLDHKNVVRCVGFCREEYFRVLVFENVLNHITLWQWHQGEQQHVHRKWPVRKSICLGVAYGIHYLHAVCVPNSKIIHRQIHPHNILLNDNLEPKIKGFIHAIPYPDVVRSMEIEDVSNGKYAAPETKQHGRLWSEKVDVYSYGVVLREIVSGRSPNDDHLGEWAWKCKDSIDPSLDLEPNEEMEAVRMLKVAFLCMQRVPESRPDMSLVVAMLQRKEDAKISTLLLEHGKKPSR